MVTSYYIQQNHSEIVVKHHEFCGSMGHLDPTVNKKFDGSQVHPELGDRVERALMLALSQEVAGVNHFICVAI